MLVSTKPNLASTLIYLARSFPGGRLPTRWRGRAPPAGLQLSPQTLGACDIALTFGLCHNNQNYIVIPPKILTIFAQNDMMKYKIKDHVETFCVQNSSVTLCKAAILLHLCNQIICAGYVTCFTGQQSSRQTHFTVNVFCARYDRIRFSFFFFVCVSQ